MPFRSLMTVGRLVSLLTKEGGRDRVIASLSQLPLTMPVAESDHSCGDMTRSGKPVPIPERLFGVPHPFREHMVRQIFTAPLPGSQFRVAPLHCEVHCVWPSSDWGEPMTDILVVFPPDSFPDDDVQKPDLDGAHGTV